MDTELRYRPTSREEACGAGRGEMRGRERRGGEGGIGGGVKRTEEGDGGESRR